MFFFYKNNNHVLKTIISSVKNTFGQFEAIYAKKSPL